MALGAGDRLGSYEIVAPLGAGGMGEVYRARQVRLGREVAVKILPPRFVDDPERLRRFEREARSASALNHPNIVTIYDVDEHEGTPYLAMELVDGQTLRRLLDDGPLDIDRVIAVGRQTADGLAKAHEAGIIHRDLKPENVMVTRDGLVKILDFGLAKLADPGASTDSGAATISAITRKGDLTGTLQYLAPEQIAGRPADRRSDQFAFGVVLYELLCGRRPFAGETTAAVLGSIMNDAVPSVRSLRADTPAELDRMVSKCLEKDPVRRHGSMSEVGRELERIEHARATPRAAGVLSVRRPVALALAAAVLVMAGAAAWWYIRSAGERWARSEALPEVASLIDEGRIYDAYRLARQAEERIPGDDRLQELLNRITMPASVATTPAGALVEIKGYHTPDEPWRPLGETPMQVRLPYALMRWRISKAGFEPFEGAPFGTRPLGLLMTGLPLQPAGTGPPGMVWVPGGTVGHRDFPAKDVTDYWLDRLEVSNREYQAFVDAGGYATPEYWTEPIIDNGRELSFEEAMARFRDATGRPGPAGWEFGVHPEGRGDYPVGGLSWFEAAAYCAFAGKRLPTVYHWFNATRQDQLSDIIGFSNFGTDGPVPVGSLLGMGDYGTIDMAGNVKEWAWNASGDLRYILGGSWREPSYQFVHPDARSPFERLPTHGVRCARLPESVAPDLLEPVDVVRRDRAHPPVSDEVFDAYRGLYAYDHTELDSQVEAVDDGSPYWRKETVSFTAAYGGERVTALVFLPRSAAPPYQVVLWLPGGDAFFSPSSEVLASRYLFDFLPRTGRAVVYPIYKGLYERRAPSVGPLIQLAPAERRDVLLIWYKDLARTLDYLETREDIDSGKVALYGFSAASYGTIFTAVDGRFKASVLLSGGLMPDEQLPEMDPVNFAPRSRVPTLMINGRDDFIFPAETLQAALFDRLGASEADKRHALLEGGHLPPDRRAIIREVLAWLDRYLGPVTPAGTTATDEPGR